jgi:hypothetical protein
MIELITILLVIITIILSLMILIPLLLASLFLIKDVISDFFFMEENNDINKIEELKSLMVKYYEEGNDDMLLKTYKIIEHKNIK